MTRGGTRVLAVGSMYPPHHLGGYELAWQAAMAHLSSRGHQLRVLTSDFRTDTDAPDEPGTFRELRWYWREHAWPETSWRERVALERHNGAVLERHLAQHRPHVVTWWAMGGLSLGLIERVRRAGVPAVAFVHDDWMTYGPAVDQWLRPFRRRPRLAALAERITGLPTRVPIDDGARCVFVSETVRAHARGAGYALPGSEVAHSGIDPSYLDPRPEREWGWRLLYVGRLDERKGVLDAVTALATLPPEATLTIAGAGDRALERRVRERALALGLGRRMRMLGMCSREALPDVYAAADAVLFPVRWEEPWGLVPLEAMALGRPVIATGRGGSGEYLRDGENCMIVRPGEPAAIERAVRRLAGDPALRARLRAGGGDTARRHTDRAFNEAVREAVERAAASASARDPVNPSVDVSAHHAP